jgi:2,3-bisphosphoglycerate-dependent phosphoglycerate mutase
MDYAKVFGLPTSVKSWIEALQLPEDIYRVLEASGYTTLLSCAYLEDSDVKELNISLPGHRRTLLAGATQLKATLERIKTKVVAQEYLPDLDSPSPPLIETQSSRKSTPICNSAIPRGVAPDYWDRARSRDRFQDRVRGPDGIHLMLVRHAQSLANVDMKYYTTHSDYSIPLSEEGIHQAAETGRQIATHYRRKHQLPDNSPPPVDWQCRIWTSPYVRTRQTSKLIMENSDGWVTDIQENVLLVEQNFGLFEGADWYSGELDDKYPDELHHYQKAAAFGGRFWAKIPLGESRFDVCLRVSQCFGTIHRDVSRCNIRNFVIVSHGTTLRAFTMMWLRLLPEWFEEEPNPANASIRIIDDYQDDGYIWPIQRTSSPIIDNSILSTSRLDILDAHAQATATPSINSLSQSYDSDQMNEARDTLRELTSIPRPEGPSSGRSVLHSSSPHHHHHHQTHGPLSSSSNHSHISNPHHVSSYMLTSKPPLQYGGSEDALLRSSASIHPINSLKRTQEPHTTQE